MNQNRTVVVRVEVAGSLLTWARQRSGIPDQDLARRFPQLREWESGAVAPTVRQLEKFAQATHTPVDYLRLPAIPEISVPLPDLRTRSEGSEDGAPPSANLLDTIAEAQQRQEWYRAYAKAAGEDPVVVAGSLRAGDPVAEAAAIMRTQLEFGLHQRGASREESLRRLAAQAEELGILVMISGVVGSNTHRVLDPAEFLGFALADSSAPTVFVNGRCPKPAQIFTLAHELAHIWLGQSALDNPAPGGTRTAVRYVGAERWCSEVAAEMLVPIAAIRRDYDASASLTKELDRLARKYRVSTLVVLRRLRDARYVPFEAFWDLYDREVVRARDLAAARPARSGGNFYNTQPARTSKRFARAIIASTLEGQTRHAEAFRLLGFKQASTLNELARHLGVA